MGAEAIQELLRGIDLEKEYHELRKQLGGRYRTEARQNHEESGSGRGIPEVRKQAGVDDYDSYPGHSAGYASDGTAGRWTFCDI